MTPTDPTPRPDADPAAPVGVDWEKLAKASWLAGMVAYGEAKPGEQEELDIVWNADRGTNNAARHEQVARAVVAALEPQGFAVVGRDDLALAAEWAYVIRGDPEQWVPACDDGALERLESALAAPPVGAGEVPTPCDHRGRWIQRPEDSHDGRGATICPTCHGRWPLYPEPAP